MSDTNVIVLPVIRVDRDPGRHTVMRQVTFDWPIDDKVRVAAKMARCSPEQLIEALTVYGLAAIEKQPVEGFLLTMEVEAAKQRSSPDRKVPIRIEDLPDPIM